MKSASWNRGQGGLSLVELLLVITIVMAGVAAAFIFGNKKQQEGRAASAGQMLVQIAQRAMGSGEASVNYGMLGNDAKSVLPASMFDGANLRPSAWGAVVLRTNAGVMPHESFTVRFEAVPPDACVALMGKSYEGYAKAEINGALVWKAGEPLADPATVLGACSASGNAMEFTSMKLAGVFVAPVSCVAPQYYDPVLKACANVVCIAPQVYNAASNSCSGGGPPVVTCIAPLVLNPAGTLCIPPVTCVAPQIYDAGANACVTPLVCMAPQVPNGTGTACITPPITCVAPQYYDAVSNTCKSDPVCVAPQTLNAATHLCESPLTCVAPKVLDTSTHTCVDPPVPVAGTELNHYCAGYVYTHVMADGAGGTYLVPEPINEFVCGYLMPAAGTIMESACGVGSFQGMRYNKVSNGPGLGFHMDYFMDASCP